MTAEDRIHLALVLALGAANVALCWDGPGERAAEHARAAGAAALATPTAITPAELEAAIDRLELWLAPTRAQTAASGPYPLALQGLGPPPEDRGHPERWLARVLGPDAASAWLAPTAAALAKPEAAPPALTVALVVLLEAGVPLERSLASSAAEKAPAVELSELVRRALGDAGLPRAADDPWQLDLLSLAVLGGMAQYREQLAQRTHQSLRRLELAQRMGGGQPGIGELDEQLLEQLARARRESASADRSGALELHWSAAVFRATAVLAEADLDSQARRHLHALLTRYQNDRALYRYLQRKARSAPERRALQLEALENFGRLEQALYNAHLTFRSGSDASPSAQTAQVMRFAARDLIEQLQGLEARDFGPAQAAPDPTRAELLRAAVQALRGLRTARVAG